MYVQKRAILLVLALGLIGGFSFAICAQQQDVVSERGYEQLWRRMPDTWRLGYVMGYSDSEQLLRSVLKNVLLKTEQGKALEQLEKDSPIPQRVNFGQVVEGINEFYKDFRNRRIDLFGARRVVFLELVGRPASEIDAVLRELRADSNK